MTARAAPVGVIGPGRRSMELDTRRRIVADAIGQADTETDPADRLARPPVEDDRADDREREHADRPEDLRLQAGG